MKTSKVNFDDLETSTKTVMVYTNVNFNQQQLFIHIPLVKVDIPYTKKQKNVDKKKLVAPDGAIISLQISSKIRGINMRKNKKIWCNVCRPTIITPQGREKKINTVTEVTYRRKSKIYPSDTLYIRYYCSRCDKMYEVDQIKKINHFLNQLTLVLSIGKQPLLNIMLFKDSMKIAGCKSIDDAKEAVLCLWDDYLTKIPNAYTMKPNFRDFYFNFDKVMRNVGLMIGFRIEREALNKLMNRKEYKDRVFMSHYESTGGTTNVNIKMYAYPPKDFKYERLVIKKDGEKYFDSTTTLKYEGKEKNKPSYVTFIVFSSSAAIISGKYDESMKECCDFFLDLVKANRGILKEKISKINKVDVKKLLANMENF